MSHVSTDRCLLLTFDERYALPGLVAMHSALSYSPASVGVTVASVGLSSTTIDRLRSAAQSHGRVLSVVEVEGLVDSLPTGLPRFSPAAWARIYIDRIIGPATGRIVYLDADTYCRAPIHELFEMDLDGLPLAAVPDPWEPTHEARGEAFWTAAATRPASGYFNSGVMVVDRSAWVAGDVTGMALGVIADAQVPTRSVDQDVLNAVLSDRWTPLDTAWNTPGNETESIDNARIVHFVGERKPWHPERGGGPFVDEYLIEAKAAGWDA